MIAIDPPVRILSVLLRYSSAYIFGAVCPERDTGVAIVLPRASTEGMNVLLTCRHGHIRWSSSIMLAGHVSDELKVPTASQQPELNTIKKVWQCLGGRYLSGRLFTSVAAVIDASCKVWNARLGETGRIPSIASRNWAAPIKPDDLV